MGIVLCVCVVCFRFFKVKESRFSDMADMVFSHQIIVKDDIRVLNRWCQSWGGVVSGQVKMVSVFCQ